MTDKEMAALARYAYKTAGLEFDAKAKVDADRAKQRPSNDKSKKEADANAKQEADAKNKKEMVVSKGVKTKKAEKKPEKTKKAENVIKKKGKK